MKTKNPFVFSGSESDNEILTRAIIIALIVFPTFLCAYDLSIYLLKLILK
jgi:hypothetical protein